jgi:capsular polysaccharide transport system permease protein
MARTRSSAAITFAVWKALFLREAVTRLSAGRAAWLWILIEPLVHVVVLMTIFGFVYHRIISGVDGAMFIMTGLLGFFMARNTATRSIEAINANSALFAYRQVHPVDTVLVRAILEGFLLLIITLVLLTGAYLDGYPVVPKDPLQVVLCFAGMWMCGTGLGLILSVAAELVAELGKIARMIFLPLYFMSGVMYPAIIVPHPYRDWLLLNPFMNGLELIRGGFFPQYQVAPEASLSYLFGFALVTIFFGLALHVRYAEKLVER